MRRRGRFERQHRLPRLHGFRLVLLIACLIQAALSGFCWVMLARTCDTLPTQSAAAAPDVGGGLGDERAGHLPQHGEAEHRQRRLDQAGNEEGKLPSVQPRQPAMPLKPPAPDHPLSASRTCLPASTGLLLVVMMKSPELMPETAADLSSRASSCTVTRVAM